MSTSKQFSLKWNDFQDNLSASFMDLRKQADFADVSLACEDGYQLEAHKIILGASSPFFKTIFKTTKHPHPLIYMKGIKSEDLLAIINFLYQGEVKLLEENLHDFLITARDMKLMGMPDEGEIFEEDHPSTSYQLTSAEEQLGIPFTKLTYPDKNTLTSELLENTSYMNKDTDTPIKMSKQNKKKFKNKSLLIRKENIQSNKNNVNVPLVKDEEPTTYFCMNNDTKKDMLEEPEAESTQETKEKVIHTENNGIKESSSLLDIENHGSLTFQDWTILDNSINLKKQSLPEQNYPNTTVPSTNDAIDKPPYESLSDKKTLSRKYLCWRFKRSRR